MAHGWLGFPSGSSKRGLSPAFGCFISSSLGHISTWLSCKLNLSQLSSPSFPPTFLVLTLPPIFQMVSTPPRAPNVRYHQVVISSSIQLIWLCFYFSCHHCLPPGYISCDSLCIPPTCECRLIFWNSILSCAIFYSWDSLVILFDLMSQVQKFFILIF
jgi:hypothetical protein